MRIECYVVLHYGIDYLPYALRSVYDQVDRLHVVYTPHPSHGHKSNMIVPESMAELADAATSVGPKVKWYHIDSVHQEGAHRDYARSLCKGDMTLVLDADEVWDGRTLDRLFRFSMNSKSRDVLINFTHLWRSFNWACNDNMWPVRVHVNGAPGPTAYFPKDNLIHHFGYAVRDSIMRYKMSCHGHKGEWFPTWYEKKWQAWPPVKDAHPTCAENTWEPKPFDKHELPGIMREHPFWNLERID